MLGPSGNIFRQAYSLARGHKTFWRLGLLLAWPTVIKAAAFVYVIGLFVLEGQGGMAAGTEQVPQANPWAGLVIVTGLVMLSLLHYRSAAILQQSVKHLKDNRELDERVVDSAEPHTIRMLKSGMIFLLVISSLAVAFSSPVMYLFSQEWSGQAISLAALTLAVAVPVMFVVYAAGVLNPLFLCLLNMPAPHAFRATTDMIRRSWPTLVGFTALAWLLELLGMAVSFLAGSAIFWLFVELFRIIYDMYGLMEPILARGLAGTLGFMVFFTSLAWIASILRIAWTILFLEMARPVQSEEVIEEEPIPETAA